VEHALFADMAADWIADHAYGPAFASIWGILHRHMPYGLYRRYRHDWQDWFTHTLKENEFRARGEIPDLDTYLGIRRLSVGLRPYIVGVEYVLDLDFTDLIAASPELRAVKLAAVEHAMLVNDLFSFRWECFKDDYFNTVGPLVHVHGLSLQEAVDVTCDRIRAADEDMERLSAGIRRRYPGQVEIHAYVDALGAFCAGNLRWSLETSRYHGHGYGWNGLRSGTVTLHPDRTSVGAA
jgi:hypothetical protein